MIPAPKRNPRRNAPRRTSAPPRVATRPAVSAFGPRRRTGIKTGNTAPRTPDRFLDPRGRAARTARSVVLDDRHGLAAVPGGAGPDLAEQRRVVSAARDEGDSHRERLDHLGHPFGET